jgi:Crinkler effector protein N-terminal domain
MCLCILCHSADNNSLELGCIISGDSRPFKVTAPIDNTIFQLKGRIYEEGKNGILRGAKDFDLWKVSSFINFCYFHCAF